MALQTSKNRLLFIAFFTLVHLVLSVLLFLWSFSIVMGKLDDGRTLAYGQELIIHISDIFLWPVFIPLGQAESLREILPAWSAIFILLLNSLLWAIVALMLVLSIQKIRYLHGNKTSEQI
jgi:hypothetical protein